MAFHIYTLPLNEYEEFFLTGEIDSLGSPLFKLEMGEFDKMQPLWDFLQYRGIKVDYFLDLAVPPIILRQLFQEKEDIIVHCLKRKPFGEEHNRIAINLVNTFVSCYENFRVIVGICD